MHLKIPDGHQCRQYKERTFGPVDAGSCDQETAVNCLTVSPQRLKHTESDRLQVQIQAYLDNVFDVGTLLEDAETKTAALERVEEMEESLARVRPERGHSLRLHLSAPRVL